MNTHHLNIGKYSEDYFKGNLYHYNFLERIKVKINVLNYHIKNYENVEKVKVENKKG